MANDSLSLYQVKHVRQLEQLALQKFGLTSEILMQRAGRSALAELRACWPRAKHITVICGKGNNAGDGYVLARYAKLAKLKVKILQLAPYSELTPPAKIAAWRCQQLKIPAKPFTPQELQGSEVIVDAILGIGLSGMVSTKLRAAIDAINASKIPVLALDLPSGIEADTGQVLGSAIYASVTITFIGFKVGLFIGEARNYRGVIVCNQLGLPPKLWQLAKCCARSLVLEEELKHLPPRQPTAHKGHFGHVLVIGGDYGMGGASRLAAEAALKVGAGLVTVATRPKNALLINAVRPEIMAIGINSGQQLKPLLQRASVVVVGPGLGTAQWGRALFKMALTANKPLVIDADALNILAATAISNKKKGKRAWVLTPHPGEAARLLNTTPPKIQSDRLAAIQKMQNIFGGVWVLKGAGSVVATVRAQIRVCDAGNPGMASAGMGDLLSGLIAGLCAQGLSLLNAATLGVIVHAVAGDQVAAKQGRVGMLALDLLPEVRNIINARYERGDKR